MNERLGVSRARSASEPVDSVGVLKFPAERCVQGVTRRAVQRSLVRVAAPVPPEQLRCGLREARAIAVDARQRLRLRRAC
eukprot:3292883-Rhodomonas_salina.1